MCFMQPQVLGLSPGTATSETVQRAYKRALNDAKGDKSRVDKIEAAHTSIMMSGLNKRMQVGSDMWLFSTHAGSRSIGSQRRNVRGNCLPGCLTPSCGAAGQDLRWHGRAEGGQVRRSRNVLPLAPQVTICAVWPALVGEPCSGVRSRMLDIPEAPVTYCNVAWRGAHRKFVAEARFIQIVGAVQLLLAAWALLSSVSAGTQPLVACELWG